MVLSGVRKEGGGLETNFLGMEDMEKPRVEETA